jgi:hypothetical protein
MYWARKAGLASILAGVFSTMGCCYHAQHFGCARDIGLGKVGCGTCMNGHDCCRPKSTCAACGTDEGGGRGNTTATVSYEDAPQAPSPGASIQRPVYVVQPQKISTGLVVNPNMVISPMPNLPAREIPVHDAQQ